MEETRVPFVTETVDLRNKSAAFLAKYEEANPGGRAKVPIVEIDGLGRLHNTVRSAAKLAGLQPSSGAQLSGGVPGPSKRARL